MNDMTPMGIGHNGAPDPIDEINARYEGDRLAAESWADGAKVENAAQMKEADALRKQMRQWRLDLEAGQKSATAPLYDAYKAEGERWKPTIADAKRIEGCLVASVDDFKRAEDARKAEIARLAREEEARKLREVEAAAAAARQNPADLEAQRAADAAAREAEQARINAAKASKDTVKGMRTVTRTVVLDEVGLARALWAQDREAQVAFQADRARLLKLNIPGVVEQRTEKEAF